MSMSMMCDVCSRQANGNLDGWSGFSINETFKSTLWTGDVCPKCKAMIEAEVKGLVEKLERKRHEHM